MQVSIKVYFSLAFSQFFYQLALKYILLKYSISILLLLKSMLRCTSFSQGIELPCKHLMNVPGVFEVPHVRGGDVASDGHNRGTLIRHGPLPERRELW